MGKQNEQPDWTERIAQFKASGQSMAAWCRANNIKVHHLRYRLNKAEDRTNGPGAGWLPLLPDGEPETPPLLIKVGAATIEVTPGFDPALLRTVVRALSSP